MKWTRSDTHEHGGAQVELVEQLRDEDVCLDDLFLVEFLDAAQDVEQPLELALTGRHPDEVHLHMQRHAFNYQPDVPLSVCLSVCNAGGL